MSDKLQEALDKLTRTYLFENPRSGWKHKAWGGAKRNPRLTIRNKTERAKRAIAQRCDLLMMKGVAHFAGSAVVFNDPGVPLRSTPGFMLSPRFAG